MLRYAMYTACLFSVSRWNHSAPCVIARQSWRSCFHLAIMTETCDRQDLAAQPESEIRPLLQRVTGCWLLQGYLVTKLQAMNSCLTTDIDLCVIMCSRHCPFNDMQPEWALKRTELTAGNSSYWDGVTKVSACKMWYVRWNEYRKIFTDDTTKRKVICNIRTGIAQSVYRLATGWTVHNSNPGGGETNPGTTEL
jgi:hypothetical protein